jgi:2-amino-4-hydroxy-6-hydroxymethyldihydropteridine diphosphokinase
MHKRAFVLIPLLEIAPHWRHPALGLCVGALLRRIDRRLRSEVRQTLDFAASLCHNSRE